MAATLPPPPTTLCFGSFDPSVLDEGDKRQQCSTCAQNAAQVAQLTESLSALSVEKQTVMDSIIASSSRQIHDLRIQLSSTEIEQRAQHANHLTELTQLRIDSAAKLREKEREFDALKASYESKLADMARDAERSKTDVQKRTTQSSNSEVTRLKTQVKLLTNELENEKELTTELLKKVNFMTDKCTVLDTVTQELADIKKQKKVADISSEMLALEIYDLLHVPAALEATRWWLESNFSKMHEAARDGCVETFASEAMIILSNWKKGQLDKLVDKNVRTKIRGVYELYEREKRCEEANNSLAKRLPENAFCIHIHDTLCVNPAHAAVVAHERKQRGTSEIA